MLDERTARRPEFREGRWVCLSDARRWSLPVRVPTENDDEYDSLLHTISQSEDQNERLLGELALTIHLLAKNYHLRPLDIQALLQFDPHDPALRCLQRDVHDLVVASLGVDNGRKRVAVSEPVVSERPIRTWSLSWFGLPRRGGSPVSSHPSTPVA